MSARSIRGVDHLIGSFLWVSGVGLFFLFATLGLLWFEFDLPTWMILFAPVWASMLSLDVWWTRLDDPRTRVGAVWPWLTSCSVMGLLLPAVAAGMAWLLEGF